MYLYHFLDGKGMNSSCPGWVGSAAIWLAFLCSLPAYTELRSVFGGSSQRTSWWLGSVRLGSNHLGRPQLIFFWHRHNDGGPKADRDSVKLQRQIENVQKDPSQLVSTCPPWHLFWFCSFVSVSSLQRTSHLVELHADAAPLVKGEKRLHRR